MRSEATAATAAASTIPSSTTRTASAAPGATGSPNGLDCPVALSGPGCSASVSVASATATTATTASQRQRGEANLPVGKTSNTKPRFANDGTASQCASHAANRTSVPEPSTKKRRAYASASDQTETPTAVA